MLLTFPSCPYLPFSEPPQSRMTTRRIVGAVFVAVDILGLMIGSVRCMRKNKGMEESVAGFLMVIRICIIVPSLGLFADTHLTIKDIFIW